MPLPDGRKQVILFSPMVGFYSRVSRDLPLALLAISRYLHPDYAVTIVDQKIAGWREKLDAALRRGALCFGATSTTGKQIHFALEASRYVKEHSDVPVIWGGIHATTLPAQTLAHPCVDMVMEGEGEVSFNLLVRRLDAGERLDDIPGLWRKEGGRIVEGPRPEGFLDLDALPLLPYELLDPADYRSGSSQLRGDVFDVETGRGCKYRCAFCYNSIYNKGKRRGMSAARILDHIRHLKDWTAVEGVSFVDDNFFLEADRVHELIERFRTDRPGVAWYCSTDVNELKRMDDAALRGLEEIGLKVVEIGVESGSQRILKMVNKPVQIEDVLAVNRRLRGFAFTPHYNFICGYVTETDEELRQTTSLFLQLADENPEATTTSLGIAVPTPGTRYLEMAREHGFVEPQRLEDWGTFNFAEWADHCPWMDARKRKLYKVLHVASLFVSRKSAMHIPGRGPLAWMLRLFARLYRPFARWRYRRCYGGLALDLKLFEFTERRLMR